MTATLRRWVASSMPVPRPVTAAGAAPVMTATIALAAVVLPMPMSPMPTSVDAGGAQVGDGLQADRDGAQRLRPGHGRALGHVGRPGTDPRLNEAAATLRLPAVPPPSAPRRRRRRR